MPWFSKKNDEGLYKSTRGSLTGTGKSLALSANDTWTSTSSNLTTFRDPKTDVDTSVIAYLAFSKKKASGYLAWKTAADEMRYYPIGVEGYITSVKPLTSTPSTRPVINVEVEIVKASTVKCSGFSVDASKTDCSDAQLTINNDMAIAAADYLFREAIPIITGLAAYKIIDPIPTYVVSNTKQNIVARVTLKSTTYSVDRTGTVKDIAESNQNQADNINTIILDDGLTTIPIMYPFKTRESLTALKTTLVARQTAITKKTTAEQNLQTFRTEEDKAIKENTVKVDRAKRGVKAAETLNALCGPEYNGAFPESVLDVNTCATMSKAVTALKQGNSPQPEMKRAVDAQQDTSSLSHQPPSPPLTAAPLTAAPPINDSGVGVSETHLSLLPRPDLLASFSRPPVKDSRMMGGSDEGVNVEEMRALAKKWVNEKHKMNEVDGGRRRRSRKRMNKNKRASSRHRHSRRHSRRHMHGHNSRKRYSAGSKSKSASKRRRNQ